MNISDPFWRTDDDRSVENITTRAAMSKVHQKMKSLEAGRGDIIYTRNPESR